MATYLPNVDKYVSKTESFTPDFKFLSDALGRRQDRYDTNYKKMNNLYGSVLHADLTRDDNMELRDTYTKNLAPKLQQISGVDFSLQQNVEAARALFTPFFEDDKMVRDIVFTKRYKGEVNKFNNFRKSKQEENRKKYWDGAIQMLNFSLDDFKKGSRDESMSVRLPEGVENVNLTKLGFDALKASGMEVQDVSISKDGMYTITQKNGVALTRRAVGKKENGDMIYTNPAQDFILQTVMDDPQIQRYYQTKFYVEARTFWENPENQEKHGGEDGAKNFFLQDQVTRYGQKVTEENKEKAVELKNSTEGRNSWDSHIDKNGNLIPGSKEMTTYERHMAEHQFLVDGLDKKEKRDAGILDENDEDLMFRAGNAYMSFHIDNDTRAAASAYADVGAERTIKADEYALKNHQSKLNMIEGEADAYNQRLNTMLGKGYSVGPNGELIKMPWADDGTDGNSRSEGNSTGVDFGDGYSSDDVSVRAGDGNATMDNVPEEGEIVDIIADNMATTDEAINQIRGWKWDAIEKYYTTKSSEIADNDNQASVEGMMVNGKFMIWKDARAHYMNPKNKTALGDMFRNLLAIADNETTGPELEKSNPNLYNTIKGTDVRIDNKSVWLYAGWDKMTTAYKNVVEQLILEGEINYVQGYMLEHYPLFNTRGKMQKPEDIMSTMKKDFIAWYDGTGGNLQNENLTEIAQKFGFQDVADLKKNLNPKDHTFGGTARVRTSKEQITRGKTTIQWTADKHFENIYDEMWSKDNVGDLFQNIRDKVNTKMQTSSAIPGVQNFNLASFLTNQEQAGTGGTLFNYHDMEYVNGQVNNAANDQIRIIKGLLDGPKQNYSVMLGNQSTNTEAMIGQNDETALMLVRQNLKDLRIPPGDFTKGTGPNMTVTWAENLGATGDKSGWVLTYGEGYASTLKSTAKTWNNNIAAAIPQNAITIFATEEFGKNNPMSVKNTYVSTTEFLVDENRTRIIDNDGGRVIFFRDGQGRMNYKQSTATYNKETGNIEYTPYAAPSILPPSGFAVDLIFQRFDDTYENQAKINHDAMNMHKKEKEDQTN